MKKSCIDKFIKFILRLLVVFEQIIRKSSSLWKKGVLKKLKNNARKKNNSVNITFFIELFMTVFTMITIV